MKINHLLIATIILSFSGVSHSSDNLRIPFKLAKGKQLYTQNCSACHGRQLQGTDKGPPFLHAFYKPSHHGDDAFYRAPLNGVKAHHWRFGNMPPVKGITKKKLNSIIPFIRFYQKQKGIS